MPVNNPTKITLTGDVTGSGTGSFAATIASGAVTTAKTALTDASEQARDGTETIDGTWFYATEASVLWNVMTLTADRSQALPNDGTLVGKYIAFRENNPTGNWMHTLTAATSLGLQPITGTARTSRVFWGTESLILKCTAAGKYEVAYYFFQPHTNVSSISTSPTVASNATYTGVFATNVSGISRITSGSGPTILRSGLYDVAVEQRSAYSGTSTGFMQMDIFVGGAATGTRAITTGPAGAPTVGGVTRTSNLSIIKALWFNAGDVLTSPYYNRTNQTMTLDADQCIFQLCEMPS